MEKNNAHTNNKLKKVVVIGPESTGKSSLASILAEHYGTIWVPEYARQYIDVLSRPYKESDLIEIARGQIHLEDEMALQAKNLLICDTDLIVIKVWYEHKYGQCPKEILDEIGRRKYDLHLLTYPDIPWQHDPQREHPHLRGHFYDIFKAELEQYGLPFVEIKGDYKKREHLAIKSISLLL